MYIYIIYIIYIPKVDNITNGYSIYLFNGLVFGNIYRTSPFFHGISMTNTFWLIVSWLKHIIVPQSRIDQKQADSFCRKSTTSKVCASITARSLCFREHGHYYDYGICAARSLCTNDWARLMSFTGWDGLAALIDQNLSARWELLRRETLWALMSERDETC